MESNASSTPASSTTPTVPARRRQRRPPSALPRRKPSLGELAAVAFAIFLVVPVLFSAIGAVAYAAQGVTERTHDGAKVPDVGQGGGAKLLADQRELGLCLLD